jgi:hypothetical protein
MRMRRLGAAALLWVLATGPLAATTTLPLAFDELVSRADTIVRGRVVAVQVFEEDGPGRPIVTRVTIAAERVLKGPGRPQVVIELLGGRLGDRELVVADSPRFAVGDRAVFHIRDGRHLSPIVGFTQGRFPVTTADGVSYVTLPGGHAFDSVAAIGRPVPFATARPIRTLTLAAFEAEIVRAVGAR